MAEQGLSPEATNEQLAKAREAVGAVAAHSRFNRTMIISVLWVTVGIILSLLVSLGGLIQSSFAEKATSYQALLNKVNEQNNKMDQLNQKLDYYQAILNYEGSTQATIPKKR